MVRRTFLAGFLVISAFAFLQAQGTQRPATSSQTARPTAAAPQQPPRPAMAAPMASVDPALFKGLKYRLVGPSRVGRVTTVTGVPSQPRTFYMGVASGGLFRTT